MHELDPPRSYRTIFVCGGFGLGSERQQDIEALSRFHECLEPGGTLVLDNESPYSPGYPWPSWRKDVRAELPQPRQELDAAERRRGSDGAEYSLESRLLELDPLGQFATYEMRAAMWRDGDLVREEEHSLRINLYFKNELLLLLEGAGFTDIAIQGDYRDGPATSDSDFVVFVARRP